MKVAVAVLGLALLAPGATPSPGAHPARPFEVSGRAVTGVSSPNGAPVLTAKTGSFRDTMPSPEESRFYLVQRTIPGSTLYVGATVQRGGDAANVQLRARLSTPDDTECDASDTWDDHGSVHYLVTAGLTTWDPDDATTRETCTSAQRLLLEVDHYDDNEPFAGTPIQLTVSEEPPVASDTGLPTASPSTPAWSIMPAAKDEKVDGAASFEEAPVIGSGQYVSRLRPGTTRLYRVRVRFGQLLQAHVRFTTPPGDTASRYYDTDQGYGLQIVSPSRMDGRVAEDGYAGTLDPEKAVEAQIRTMPVTRAFRNSGDWSQRAASVSGYYYIAVHLGADQNPGQEYDVPFVLNVQTIGSASKQPAYAKGADPIGPAFEVPEDPANTVRPKPTDAGAFVLGGSGLALFLCGGVVLLILRRTRTKTRV